jgi:hypothetical protein
MPPLEEFTKLILEEVSDLDLKEYCKVLEFYAQSWEEDNKNTCYITLCLEELYGKI